MIPCVYRPQQPLLKSFFHSSFFWVRTVKNRPFFLHKSGSWIKGFWLTFVMFYKNKFFVFLVWGGRLPPLRPAFSGSSTGCNISELTEAGANAWTHQHPWWWSEERKRRALTQSRGRDTLSWTPRSKVRRRTVKLPVGEERNKNLISGSISKLLWKRCPPPPNTNLSTLIVNQATCHFAVTGSRAVQISHSNHPFIHLAHIDPHIRVGHWSQGATFFSFVFF